MFLEAKSALLATRRPRSATEAAIWCAHVVACGQEAVGTVTCETDRAKFVGRGRSVRNAMALDEGAELSGTVGAVLDPIFSLRVKVRIPPGGSAHAPLATPRSAREARHDGTPEQVSAFESVRLFVDRAQAVKPDFQVTNANAPTVAKIRMPA